MNGQEIKFMRDFKKLQKEVEDMVMTEINDKICEYADKKANDIYIKILKESEEIIEILDKMNDVKSYLQNFDELYEELDNFYDSCDISKCFNSESDFSKEISSMVFDSIDLKIKEMSKLIVLANKLNYQKIKNNLKLQFNKTIKTVVYFINEISIDIITTYKKIIIDTFQEVRNAVNIKIQESKDYNYETDNCDVNQKLEKILDRRTMNNLLAESGYKPVRQNSTSHLIYSNGIKSIPVPQHTTLNKNLGYTIQKQIKEDKHSDSK